MRQMDRFGPKGAPGQNINIYYVFELLGWALEGIGRLKATVEGPTRGQQDTCASMQKRACNWDLWEWSEMRATGRKFSQTQAGSEVKVYLKAKTYD